MEREVSSAAVSNGRLDVIAESALDPGSVIPVIRARIEAVETQEGAT